MQQKLNRIRLNRYIAGAAVIVIVVVAASAVVLLQYNRTDAAPAVKPATGASVPSQFSFTNTTGWFQGATNATSMAVFQTTHDCFTSVEHDQGTVNVAASLQQEQTILTNGGYTVTPGNSQTLSLQTSTGPQQYELHQYSVATPAGASMVEGGEEFGYLQLSSGYLKIEGYCNTSSELAATIPALQAIKFDETN